MPPTHYKQCPCPRCNGALIAPRTFRRHAAESRNQGQQVVPYAVWSGDFPSSASSSASSTRSSTPERDSRPPKRPRSKSLSSVESHKSMTPGIDFAPPIHSPNGSSHDRDTGNGVDYDFDDPHIDVNHDAGGTAQAAAPEANPNDGGPEPELGDIGDGDNGVADSRIEDVAIAQQFIREIRQATLDNGRLDEDVVHRLRDPIQEPIDISDADTRFSLDLFMAVTNASEETYTQTRHAILRRFPECAILSYYSVKKLVTDISGVTSVMDDMCINSCHAFTGPFSDEEACSHCSEPRYDPVQLELTGKKKPRQQSCTIPLGPQIQALRRSPEGATAMRYRDEKTRQVHEMFRNLDPTLNGTDAVYDDIFCGTEYIHLADHLSLTLNDTVISLSLDGAQLYKNKKSDTWIYIWIVQDLSPGRRYKKKSILPGGFIPGPNKLKNAASFLYRGLHHLSALQRENGGAGLRIWDTSTQTVVDSRIIFALGLADAVGLPEIDGRVGHHGANGCRIGCTMKGRHKPNSGHYYAAHLKPDACNIPDSNHPDINIRDLIIPSTQTYHDNLGKVIASTDQADYERKRKQTGISKPSILSGLDQRLCFPVPHCFGLDLMHVIFLNFGDLLISLWRGLLKCDPSDDKATWDWVTLTGPTWQEHGKKVAAATPYFPSSFHRPPRNPAEKISSGYKATEFFLYLFGLGPGHLRVILPRKYWQNFCRLTCGVRIIIQRRIRGAQMQKAHVHLVSFVEEFEQLYYQRRVDRIHFCRPCIHTLLHAAPEIPRLGPGAYYTQFTMERTIGDLGQEISQPSNPFANLAQRGLRRSQVNALKTMCPDLDLTANVGLPRGAMDVDDGYILLRARDRSPKELEGPEGDALIRDIGTSKVRRWARLRLPNGQNARSLWKECQRSNANGRVSRMVKLELNRQVEYAEVRFFFLRQMDNASLDPYALVSVYSRPDPTILNDSFNTLWACKYQGDDELRVISTKNIISVISMQPLPPLPGEDDDYWFVVEKSGLDDADMTGYIEPVDGDDGDTM